MRCEWETIAFGDLLEESVRNGLTKPKAIRGTGVKMIAMGEIFAYSRIADVVTDRVPVTEKELQNCSIEPLDILFARQSLTLEGAGKCSIVTDVLEDTVFESHLIRTRVDQRKADPFFLYYYFNSPHGKENIKSIVEQVAAAGIRGSDLIKLSVPYPCLEKQRKISAILRSLDDKIELNNKINENLERQARALLTQWLIENDGTYEFSLLSEVAAINPDTYSPKDAWEFVNYLDTSSITDGVISEVQHIKPSTEKLPSRARRIIAANDVVFSTVRPNQRHFGIINDPLGNMLASTGFAVIRSNHPSVSNELLYLRLTEDSFIEKMQQLAEQSTSTFPSIKPSDLGCCEIPCPISQEIMKTLKAIFDSISNNQKQNEALSELRDTLLPKLMSGEISIDF